MTIWPRNLFKAKNLTQKFIQGWKLDPKIYYKLQNRPKHLFSSQKVLSKNGTSRITIYGSSSPHPTPEKKYDKALYTPHNWLLPSLNNCHLHEISLFFVLPHIHWNNSHNYTDDVFITWYLFSHAEWKSDKVMTCWEILAWEFYNVRALAVFDKFL